MSSLTKKGRRKPHKTKRYSTLVTDTGRVCKHCQQFKDWSSFWPSRRSAKCISCHSALRKKPTDEEKDRRRTKNGAYSKKVVATLKKTNPCLYKAKNTRSSMQGRVKKLGLDLKVPSLESLEKWFKDQEPWVCHYSKKPLTLSRVHVDHKIPLTRGGDNSLTNLCLADSYYNEAKGQLTEAEFFELLDLVSKWEDSGKYLLARLKQGYRVRFV